MRRPAGLVIAAVLLLSGCTSAPAADPVATPTATPSATTTPTPTPPAPAAGVVAFGGDCANVLTEEQVEEILGAGALPFSEWMANYDPDYRAPASSPLERAGGIDCRWMAADDAEGLPEGVTQIGILAMPTDAAGGEEVALLADARCDPQYDATNCRLGRTSGATWVMARVGAYIETPPDELLVAALDAAEANLAEYPAPVAATREASWWAIRDCDELGEAIDLADFLGPDYRSGYWEGSPQHENFLLEAAGVGQFCQWSSDSSAIPEGEEHYIVSLTLEPGGHWRWTDLAADNRLPADVRGAKDAIRFSTAETDRIASGTTWATDGINVLQVGVEGGHVDVRIAERVLAEMG